MGDPQPSEDVPSLFRTIVGVLRNCLDDLRPEIDVREVPAPARIAPYTFALAGGLVGAEETASGRLVLLFDPDGQDAWEGQVRVVCYARAEVDPEVADDPLLPGVAWSWLQESLQAHGAATRAIGGTVTTTSSRRFGVLASDGDTFDVELRCSWSPDWAETATVGRPGSDGPGAADGGSEPDAPHRETPRETPRRHAARHRPAERDRPSWSPAETAAHLHAFADLIAAMAGLPPHLSGVVPLPARRA